MSYAIAAPELRPSGPTIRWGWLATGLAIFSVACLSTLIIVVALKKVDILSPVALALAVLSFSAQLIVTLAQGQQFGQLNADTKSALTEMRATTSSLLANQKEQVNKLLEFAFRPAIQAAVEDVTGADDEQQSTDQDERAAELESALQNRLGELLKGTWQGPIPPPVRAERQREWMDLMAEYPSRAEGEPVVEIIRKLPPQAISTLGRIAGSGSVTARKDRSVSFTRGDEEIGEGFKRLIETGLLEKVSEVQRPDGRTSDKYKLTPTGIIAARLLRGLGKPPEWAADMG